MVYPSPKAIASGSGKGRGGGVVFRWAVITVADVMSGFTFGGSNGAGPTNTATGAGFNVGTPSAATAPGLSIPQ